ncbi:MAG: helix-turn-helix domain-containing protein [Bdellovibrionia bacterium]
MGSQQHQSLYDILEVPRDAAQEDIHKAFMRAKHTYSPDSPALYSVFTKEEADELLRLIEEAYAILGNPRKRKEYDDGIDRKSNVVTPGHLSLVSEGTQAPPSNAKPAPVKDKVGRSGYSRYEIDDSLEKEIETKEVFDGAFLQRIRTYKNISIDQVTKATRIGRHYLIAVEANDFRSLPAPVFVRGFIVQIAKMLNLPEKRVADSFMKLLKESTQK